MVRKTALSVAAAAVMLFAAGCSKAPAAEVSADTADTNARTALSYIADLTERVDQLETDKSALGDRIMVLESEKEDLQRRADDTDQAVSDHDQKLQDISSTLNQ
jgi:peptidoglycan hydrolase CwlO-like protein